MTSTRGLDCLVAELATPSIDSSHRVASLVNISPHNNHGDSLLPKKGDARRWAMASVACYAAGPSPGVDNIQHGQPEGGTSVSSQTPGDLGPSRRNAASLNTVRRYDAARKEQRQVVRHTWHRHYVLVANPKAAPPGRARHPPCDQDFKTVTPQSCPRTGTNEVIKKPYRLVASILMPSPTTASRRGRPRPRDPRAAPSCAAATRLRRSHLGRSVQPTHLLPPAQNWDVDPKRAPPILVTGPAYSESSEDSQAKPSPS